MLRGNEELVEVELSDEDAGVNITLTFPPGSQRISEESYIVAVTPSPSVNLYLAQSPCTEDTLITPESNFINTQSNIGEASSTSINLSFNGPSPWFLQPNNSGTTIYCLLINSSTPWPSPTLATLRVNYIGRTLTQTELVLSPKYAIYSTVFEARYAFFDQWGTPYSHSESLPLLCGEDREDICGHTETGSSAGKVLVSFNQSLSWKLFSSVNTSLPRLVVSSSATAYGEFDIYLPPLTF